MSVLPDSEESGADSPSVAPEGKRELESEGLVKEPPPSLAGCRGRIARDINKPRKVGNTLQWLHGIFLQKISQKWDGD